MAKGTYKEIMKKGYMKKVKSLYVRASKNQVDLTQVDGHLSRSMATLKPTTQRNEHDSLVIHELYIKDNCNLMPVR